MTAQTVCEPKSSGPVSQQPERVRIERLALTFHGENGDHHVSYVNGVWNCDCHFFDESLPRAAVLLENFLGGLALDTPP